MNPTIRIDLENAESRHLEPVGDILLEPKPVIGKDEATRFLFDIWKLSGSLTALTGERDQNFRLDTDDGRKFVLKVYNRGEGHEERDLQYKLMALAKRQSEIEIPHIHPTLTGELEAYVTIDGFAHAAVLMTRLDGIAPESAASAGFRYALGRAAGALASTLDGFDHVAASRELLWNQMLLPKLAGMADLIEDAGRRRWIVDHISRFEAEIAPRASQLPNQIIHNDLNPSNILVHPHRSHQILGIIDFGDAVRAPRINELAVSASYFLKPGDGLVDSLSAIVEGYETFVRLSDEEIALLPDLIRTRLATRILLTHWRNARFPMNSAYIMRNVPNAWSIIDAVTDVSPAEIFKNMQERRQS